MGNLGGKDLGRNRIGVVFSFWQSGRQDFRAIAENLNVGNFRHLRRIPEHKVESGFVCREIAAAGKWNIITLPSRAEPNLPVVGAVIMRCGLGKTDADFCDARG